MSSGYTTEGHRRRRLLVVGKAPFPSIMFVVLAFLFVETLLVGNINIVAAEDGTLEESSGSSTGNNSNSDSPVESCIQATETLIGDDSEAANTLDQAITSHSASLVSSMTDEDWSFGFTEDSNKDFRDACDRYNDIMKDSQGGGEEGRESENSYAIFKESNGEMTLSCDMPQMKITGKSVRFYGIVDCVAATESCRDMTSMDMAKTLWENIGLVCHPTSEDGNPDDEKNEEEGNKDGSNPTVEEGDAAEEENEGDISEGQEADASEKLTPGDNSDSRERLPFLTDADVACIDSTNDFVNKNAGLKSAIATYEDSKVSKREESGVEVIGYPTKAAGTMKSACELKKGHWAFARSMNFTCVIEGMETIPVHVHHFGSCLANVDDCLQMDTTSLVKSELHDMGYNCWEDEDQEGEGTASSGDGSADTASGQPSKSAESVEEDSDTSEIDTQNEAQEGGNLDSDGDDQNEQSNGNSDGSDSSGTSDIAESMGLSESDQKCMGDTLGLTMKHSTLQSAKEEFEQSLDVDTNSLTDMRMGYPDESVAKLKSICTDSSIGGYFAIIKQEELDCEMMSADVKITLTNLADCLADTPECKKMNIMMMMEDLFQSMGVKCQDKGDADENDANSSTTSTAKPHTKPHTNDSGHGKENNGTGGSGSKSKDLDLSESDVSCMTKSTNFIDSSDNLANATMAYEKAVIMTDPTKLGFNKSSVSEMEKVCDEEGGLWSFIESQDVTCVINGRGRCINVYNFGNCIANNTDCQSMDTMVLVKTFFMDVLRFSCQAGCDKHNGNSGHSPSSSPPSNKHPGDHSSNNNNLSSKQNTGATSTITFEIPSFVVPIVVLLGLGAVGFLVVKRLRASRRREREDRRTYEMTQISDLGFKVFT